jgi:hypothetical protein
VYIHAIIFYYIFITKRIAKLAAVSPPSMFGSRTFLVLLHVSECLFPIPSPCLPGGEHSQILVFVFSLVCCNSLSIYLHIAKPCIIYSCLHLRFVSGIILYIVFCELLFTVNVIFKAHSC